MLTGRDFEGLFTPFQLGPLTLPNRFVFPLVRRGEFSSLKALAPNALAEALLPVPAKV